MKTRLTEMTTRLHVLMQLGEDCQAQVRELGDEPRNYEHTLMRLQILRVKLENMRQLVHAIESTRSGLLVPDSENVSEVLEVEAAARTARPDGFSGPDQGIDVDSGSYAE